MNYLKSIRYLPTKLYNPETKTYRDRVLANGGSISDASLDAIEKFVQDCKNSLIWDKLLEVGPFAGSNLNAALVKLVCPVGVSSTLTNINFVSADFNERGANGGLLGDGATKYLSTAFNLSAHLPDNSHVSFYLRDDIAASGNRSMLGSLTAPDQYWLGALNPAAGVNVRLGQAATATFNEPFNKGFYIGSRLAANSLSLFKDGQLKASDTTAVVHNKPNQTIYLFAFNSSGNPSAFLGGRGAFYSIGSALTEPEAAALHQAVRTLQVNLQRAVN